MYINKFLALACFIAGLSLTGCGNEDTEVKDLGIIKEAGVSTANKTTVEDKTVHTIKVRNIGRLSKVFDDVNDTHLSVAMANGITPIVDLKSALAVKIPIVKVVSCDEFYLDSLTHSLPFLRPKALDLLKCIGKNFTDTIMARCGHGYKVKVTSVLRTSVAIDRLKKRNSNATLNSAHQYGTTFDVSYSKFVPSDPNYILSQECLKNTLAEILFDLHSSGKCYVKYEVKQGCFHITTR